MLFILMKSSSTLAVTSPHQWMITKHDIPGLKEIEKSYKDQVGELDGSRLELERQRIATAEQTLRIRSLHARLSENPSLHVSIQETADSLFIALNTLYAYETELIEDIKNNLFIRVSNKAAMEKTCQDCLDLINLHQHLNRLLRGYITVIFSYIKDVKGDNQDDLLRRADRLNEEFNGLLSLFPQL